MASGNFQHALHTANVWVADVARAYGTDDHRLAQRVLRAWLHTLRDRLTVEAAAKFSAQLPELLRGVYYDGWEPHKVPIKYGPDGYVQRFAYEARIPLDEVRRAAAAVCTALAGHVSPGQLEDALVQLPHQVRAVVTGAAPAPVAASMTAAGRGRAGRSERDRLDALEERLGTVVEALRVLAEGLEESPMRGPGNGHGSRAARLASEILMTMPGGQTRTEVAPMGI